MAAQYPGAAGTDANLFIAANNISTSLTDNPLTSGATTVNVASTTGFPTVGYITIDAEAISYTGVTGTSFTGCTRGADGTTAASHVTATSVFHNVVAAHHNVLKDEVKAVESDLVSARAAITSGGSTMASALAAVQAYLNSLNLATVGKNRVINGEMRIDQANAGAAVSVNATAVFYGVDQFLGVGTPSAGVFTLQRSVSTPPTGFTHFLRATCSTADASIAATDLYRIGTRIEGNNVRDLLLGTANAKQFTISFWVRSSLTGTYTGAVGNSAGDRSYPFEYTINSANTWEQKTITIAGDTTGTWLTDTGIGIELRLALAIGSNFQSAAGAWAAGGFYGTSNQVNFMSSNTSRTLDLTGVQLEVGAVATPFEYRPFGVELQNCQRYYSKTFELETAPVQNSATSIGAVSYGTHTAGASQDSTSLTYPVRMRTVPTVTTYSIGAATTSWWNISTGAASGAATVLATSSTRGVDIRNAQVAGDAAAQLFGIHVTADARL